VIEAQITDIMLSIKRGAAVLKDFRDFITRGNVIDLAIAVIIGTAFTAIVNSLVDDIFMPLIGVLLGGLNFESLAFQVGEASINYGLFIQAVINFLLIALFVFFVTRAIVSMQKEFEKKEAQEPEPEPEIPQDIQLLTEIRDLLAKDSARATGD
jgi:large conductance mechanosensitive channel